MTISQFGGNFNSHYFAFFTKNLKYGKAKGHYLDVLSVRIKLTVDGCDLAPEGRKEDRQGISSL